MIRLGAMVAALAILTAAIGATAAQAGQTGTIRGRVVDASTGMPVAGVTIRVVEPGYSSEVTTSDTGFYSVMGVPLNKVAVYAAAPGGQRICPFYLVPLAAGEVRTLSFRVSEGGGMERCHVTMLSSTFDPDQTQDSYTIGTY